MIVGAIISENILKYLHEADPAEDKLEVIYKASSEVGGAVVAQDPRKPIEEDDDTPQQRATVVVSVQQVRVDVTVRDKKGNLLTGLERGHFEIYEDKVRQEIASFTPSDAPITAVLLVEYNKAIATETYSNWDTCRRPTAP